MKRKNAVVDNTAQNKLPISQMVRGRNPFKPFRHKGGAAFSDLDYFKALGEYASEGEEEWKRQHPHRELAIQGIDPEVLRFAQIVYKASKDGVSDRELEEYIADSIDVDR